ncbi:N-acetyltransferase [Paraburkholderia bonniea]|uniref:N-acetyltransferase n=1 Tax=Paraburkholderia bonniea TaxID=2152891 RepID=UPI0012909D9D|nr:N-acetyltransferase [Paraburkholderia bonniea]WJF90824.1 N-acetyltransferase [Paraburkholderia bonniea]WJF94138.1 N-acetyltransferase [Paraburkholderia bonniea]
MTALNSAAALRFRPAWPTDAAACAPLMFASGAREFRYWLGEPDAACHAFLRHAFAQAQGRFSWRWHHVALNPDGAIVGLMGVYPGSAWHGVDDLRIAWRLLRSFGLRRAPAMMRRGLVLQRELPAPGRREWLLAHCATREDCRGSGVFSALFASWLSDAALAAPASASLGAMKRFAPDGPGERPHGHEPQLVLDALCSETRVRSLYHRLGFVELPKQDGGRSAQLPPALASVRMRFAPCA